MNNLMVRTWLGFAALLLFMGLALFLPAGSFGYWQAWVYLAVFFGSVILITLYLIKYDQKLLESRVDGGPTAETQKSQQLIQSLASLCFIGMYVVAGLDYRFHWSQMSAALSLISEVFVALGFLFVFLVFKENSYTSATIEVAEEQKVITTGPYSLVRHPMYAGASVMLIASPIALGSWVALPLPFLLIFVIVLRSLEEEKFLSANLKGYEQYRQKVRHRLIPFVW